MSYVGEVRESDLVAIEDYDEQARQAAESLARRRHDQRLRDELARFGFTGPLWHRFADELARYGYAVVMAWLRSGEMFAQCKRKGCSPGPFPDSWDEDDRAGIANETVAQAIATFRTSALEKGKWRFDGGASLKTYFVGACVFAFPNPYRRWKTQHDSHHRLHGERSCAIDQDIDELVLHQPDLADTAASKVDLWAMFHDIPNESTRQAALLRAAGYSDPEIGDILQITPAAVAERLRRQRNRVNPDQHRDKRGGAR